MTECAECGIIGGGHRQVCSQWVSPSTMVPVEIFTVDYAQRYAHPYITYCKLCGNVVADKDLHTKWHFEVDRD